MPYYRHRQTAEVRYHAGSTTEAKALESDAAWAKTEDTKPAVEKQEAALREAAAALVVPDPGGVPALPAYPATPVAPDVDPAEVAPVPQTDTA